MGIAGTADLSLPPFLPLSPSLSQWSSIDTKLLLYCISEEVTSFHDNYFSTHYSEIWHT